MNLKEILKKHELWLSGDEDGERADLSWTNLSGVNLSNADLRDAYLEHTNLRYANLSGANLGRANLKNSDLNGADLRRANLITANLINANLERANMCGANLEYAYLNGTDLSGVEGLLSAIDYMNNFERTDDGYIVYKCFNGLFPTPDKWDIEMGSVIEEEVNTNRVDICGCGINVAPLNWVKKYYPHSQVYKLLIRWEWLPGVVVPYNTDGKIRCARAEIIERVEPN